MQLRSASVRPGLGANVRYAPRLSGVERPGRSPISITQHARLEDRADLVAQRNPRAGCDHRAADLDCLGGEARNQTADQFDRVGIDRGRRQPVADHDREPAWPCAMRRQRVTRVLIEHSPEIGTPEIILAVAGAAR